MEILPDPESVLLPVTPAATEDIPSTLSSEVVEPVSFVARLGDTVGAVKTDFTESEHRPRLVAMGLGTLAVQAADRLRLSVVLVPKVAVDVFQNTHSPLETGLVAGLTFAGWCVAVGGITTEGLDQYPQTVDAFKDNFPGVIDFFADALPGVDNEKSELGKKLPLARRIGERLLTGSRRGLTVSGIGTVAYVSTATAKGKSRGAVHKLNLTASAEGGVAIGGIVYGIAETVSQVSHEHPMLAERIVNDASNIKLWYAIAGLMIACQYASSRFKKFRHRHEQSPTD